MDLLFVVVVAVLSLLSGLLKKLGESGARPVMPPPPLPRSAQTWPPGQPLEAVPAEGEGTSMESGPWIAGDEGRDDTVEGLGMEGEEQSGAYLPESLQEQEEILREKQEFQAESSRLTSEDAPAPAPPAKPEDEFSLAWDDEADVSVRSTDAGTVSAGLSTERAALARAVVAAEILSPPGGWRPRPAMRR